MEFGDESSVQHVSPTRTIQNQEDRVEDTVKNTMDGDGNKKSRCVEHVKEKCTDRIIVYPLISWQTKQNPPPQVSPVFPEAGPVSR